MRFAICDGDLDFLAQLKQLMLHMLPQFCSEKIQIHTYTSGLQLLPAHTKHPFDAIFINIQLPEDNVFALFESVRRITPHVVIVFITNSPQWNLTIWNKLPQYFIRKEALESDLEETLKSFLNTYGYHHRLEFLSYRDADQDVVSETIKLDSIRYLSSDGHKITFWSNKMYCRSGSLSYYEKIYTPYGFVRSHSKYLVNSHYIVSIGEESLSLSDGTTIPLSRHRRAIVLSFFSRYGCEK